MVGHYDPSGQLIEPPALACANRFRYLPGDSRIAQPWHPMAQGQRTVLCGRTRGLELHKRCRAAQRARTRAGAKSQTDTHHPDENAVTVFDTRPWGVKAACQTSSPTGRIFSHFWRGSDGKLKLAPPARHVDFLRSWSTVRQLLHPARSALF